MSPHSQGSSQHTFTPGDPQLDSTSPQGGQPSSGAFSLPLDEHQRLSASSLGLLSAGDFQSPCDEQSMYSSFRMDDFTDPGYVSVNTYHSFPPGRNQEYTPNSFWKSAHLKSNTAGESVSSGDSPSKTTTDSLMSTSDPAMKLQTQLFEDDTYTMETITEPSDSLENLSAACGSDTEEAPPMEFHTDADPMNSKANQCKLQRTMSMQSHDKLIVHESDVLHIEAVKRALPDNLELVLWLTFLNVDNIEGSQVKGVKLIVDIQAALHMEVCTPNIHLMEYCNG